MDRAKLEQLCKTNPGIKKKKNGKIYVSNPVLYQEILKSKEQDELTKQAIEMLQVLLENLKVCLPCEDIEDEKDCMGQAMLDFLLYWRGFDPEKSSNPFAYFSWMGTNGLRKGWNALNLKKYKGEKIPKSLFTSLDNNIHTL